MAENVKENIVSIASEMMREVGIRSVSVDDICARLGISKKTFYVYFDTKDALIDALLSQLEANIEAQVLAKTKGKTVKELLLNYQKIAGKVEDVRSRPSLFHDLKKYYPQQYEKHRRNLEEVNQRMVKHFLEQGKEEGFFREDLDVDMVAHMMMKVHQYVRDQYATAKDKDRVMRESTYGFDIFMRGIMKGDN